MMDLGDTREDHWPSVPAVTPPGTLRSLLLIARRGAAESLRDRGTVAGGALTALFPPVGMALAATGGAAPAGGATLAAYLLLVGLFPTSAAVGSAAGQFAGEKEQGNLTPLLASPASNLAIFGGKTLGAVVPALLFALTAELVYLTTVALVEGAAALRRLPPGRTLAMLALVPAVAVLAVGMASLISSRVRTYNAASQLAGFGLMPIWGVLAALAFGTRGWPPSALAAVVLAVAALDAALIFSAARTWRREEVLARR
jgi:ABC-2 type transport system permease protein